MSGLKHWLGTIRGGMAVDGIKQGPGQEVKTLLGEHSSQDQYPTRRHAIGEGDGDEGAVASRSWGESAGASWGGSAVEGCLEFGMKHQTFPR